MPAGWQPAAPHERHLHAARQAGDLPAYLIALARSVLLLLQRGPDDGTWAVSRIADRSCLVTFTSLEALEAVTGGRSPHRAVRVMELAAAWPDPAWYLAINPGITLETFLDAEAVRDVAALAGEPATEVEARLARALDAADIDTYVSVLMTRDVVRPEVESALPAVVFTSMERYRDVAGDQRCRLVPFAEVVQDWPEGTDGSGLMVDPGLTHGGLIDDAVMQYLRARLR